MRQPRIKAEGRGCYHVVSRIVDRSFKMDADEKLRFHELMRRAEDFSGVRILTYTLMSNHFHILLEVPERVKIDYKELVRRVHVLYGTEEADKMVRQWETWRNEGCADLAKLEQDRLEARMYDISAFVKTLKQRYTMSYNGRHNRRGTLWEDRFKSALVEGGDLALSACAAYIDLNAVRAGIVEDPKDYRWSGYGEASAGSKLSRAGLAYIYGVDLDERPKHWKKVAANYRTMLYLSGEEVISEYGDIITRPGLAREAVEKVLAEGGKLTLAQALRCRVRYFTDGLALGGKAFVEDVFEKNRGHFGPKRKNGARKMKFADWGELRVARALQVKVVSMPLRN